MRNLLLLATAAIAAVCTGASPAAAQASGAGSLRLDGVPTALQGKWCTIHSDAKTETEVWRLQPCRSPDVIIDSHTWRSTEDRLSCRVAVVSRNMYDLDLYIIGLKCPRGSDLFFAWLSDGELRIRGTED